MKNKGIGPYDHPRPSPPKPACLNQTRPSTSEEQMYCWYYWIEAILDYRSTRAVLDKLEDLPEFRVPWGQCWETGDVIYDKTH